MTLQTSLKCSTWWTQHTQISCNKGETEVADHEIRKAKKVNIKSRLYCCSTKKVYNRVYEAVLMMIEICLNDDIMKKKRKWNSVFIVLSIYMLAPQFTLTAHWLLTLPVIYTAQPQLCYSMISWIIKYVPVNTVNNAENSISKRGGSCKVLRLLTTDDSRD